MSGQSYQNLHKTKRNVIEIMPTFQTGRTNGVKRHDDVMNLVRNGIQETEFPIEYYNYFAQQISTEHLLHVSVSARGSMMNNKKSMDSGVKLPQFDSHLCCLPAMRHWVNSVTAVSLVYASKTKRSYPI